MANTIWIVWDKQFCRFSRWTADKFICWDCLCCYLRDRTAICWWQCWTVLRMEEYLLIISTGRPVWCVQVGGSRQHVIGMTWSDYTKWVPIHKPDDTCFNDVMMSKITDYILDPVCKICLCFIKLVLFCLKGLCVTSCSSLDVNQYFLWPYVNGKSKFFNEYNFKTFTFRSIDPLNHIWFRNVFLYRSKETHLFLLSLNLKKYFHENCCSVASRREFDSGSHMTTHFSYFRSGPLLKYWRCSRLTSSCNGSDLEDIH